MTTNDTWRVVTFISKYDGLSVISKDEKVNGARLWCMAPGLMIYLKGTASGVSHDRLTNLACNLALSMNIPLISLHYVKKGK